VMSGGGSLLTGIDRLVSEKTKMPVYIAEDPLSCVVKGCAYLLEHPKLMSNIRVTKGL
jgi:rod shape-determining protein MreB